MKYQITIITAFLVFGLAGCDSGNNRLSANAAPANQPEVPVNQTAGTGSPTATMTGFIEALKNKDVEGIKKACSEASIESFEKAAAEKNMTIDQYVTRGRELNEEITPQMRNERISGNSATLEVLDPERQKWETIPFVKEDGEWKIAFEKMS